jgi:RND family efflux transporter MFP subunit
MKQFIASHIVFVTIGGVAVLSAIGAAWYVTSNHAPSFVATAATRGNVISSLNEPATVLAENNATLSFQASGQIAHVYVSEGNTVSAGTVLADLGSASLQANVQQAQAAVAAAQAQLDQLKTGTRPEQLTIDETAVTNAQSVVAVDVGNAYTSADDAVHNQTDNLFTNPKSNNPTFLVPVNDSQMMNNIQSSRLIIETVLGNWYAALNASTSTPAVLANNANSALSQVQSYLDSLALAVNDATPNSVMTATVLAGYKVDISTARTEVAAAITALTNAESTLATAQNTLTLAQAGSTPQAIEAQQAAVEQAQAALAAAQVGLGNTSLVAPFAGTVQNLTAQVGQVVSPGSPMLSLVNNSGLKIQTYVSEADVANIKDNDAAQVTLDAFGTGTTLPATVTTIDTAESQVNGTPAYLVTLHFTNPEPQVKDGMTGNVQIILAEHDNVIEVPSNLVINNNNNYFVLVQTSSGPQQKQVQVGLVGNNGMTEITSGINVGDQLTNF